ncbi:MAG TPA: DUF6572 domain-containing protein [Caulobacteraceae bacterium]|nr:DUF6572 domain-containing protein [Caulobacteraceae bacterium]
MSVLDTDIVDYVYLDDETETPVLVVSDPLTWRPPEDERHLEALRVKLNTQIAFVETGQIRQVWPPFDGRLVRVEVVARCVLSNLAEEFYNTAGEVMRRANMELSFQLCNG